MDKVYYDILKTYLKETQKLVQERVSKNDLIILEDGQKAKQTFDFISQMNQNTLSEGMNTQNLNSSMFS